MFYLDDDQKRELQQWIAAQNSKALEMQKGMDYPFGGDKPYYGATGGVLTYCFTPTSLGLVTVVKHGYTKEEIDLTDYDSW